MFRTSSLFCYEEEKAVDGSLLKINFGFRPFFELKSVKGSYV